MKRTEKTKTRILVPVICLLLAVLMLLPGCGQAKKSGKDPADTEAAIPDGSENDDPSKVLSFRSDHFDVDNNMLNYYFRFDFYDSIDKYFESYFTYYELDPTKNLKEENCKMYQDNPGTWFDYFITQTCISIQRYLVYSEAALENGTADDPEIAQSVERDIEAIKSSATEFYKISVDEFIKTRFGETVTMDDIRRALTLYYTGTHQYDLDVEEIRPEDKDLDEYFEGHKSEFLYCDFRSYQFKAKVSDNATEAEKAQEYAKAESLANELLQMNTVEKFVGWIKDYETENNASMDEPYSEAQINYHATKVTGEYAYNDSTAFGKWAFADGRKVGDMTVLDNGSGTYTVYYLVREPYRLDYDTVNFRRILVDVDDFDGDTDRTYEKAKELWDKWEASDKTEDTFTALAAEYDSNDTVLFEERGISELENDLGSWCYADGRKPGDSSLVRSEYGYYLVYFCGTGRAKWKIDAYEKVMTERINEKYNAYSDKYKVEMNQNNIYLISGVTAYTSKETSADTTAAPAGTAAPSDTTE